MWSNVSDWITHSIEIENSEADLTSSIRYIYVYWEKGKRHECVKHVTLQISEYVHIHSLPQSALNFKRLKKIKQNSVKIESLINKSLSSSD